MKRQHIYFRNPIIWFTFSLFITCQRKQTNEKIGFSTLIPNQLTVCTYGGFAPVCYKNDEGELIGLDISFIAEFAKTLDLKLVTIEKDFDMIWTMPNKNICDIAAAGIAKRTDRDIGIGSSWTKSYFEVQRSLLVRNDEVNKFNDYKNLSNKKIIVTRGSTAEIDARKRYTKCIIEYVDEVVPEENFDNAQEYVVQLIIDNKADAFAEGDVSNNYIRKNNKKKLALADIHPIGDLAETFNFVVRNESLELLERLNMFILENKDSYVSE